MFKKPTLHIFSLFSTSLLGQLIHVAALPFLSFFFSQESIGAFFFFQALVTMGSIFTSLQSEQAIVVESSSESYVCFKKSILIVLILSAFVFLISQPLAGIAKAFSIKTSIYDWLEYIAPALLILGCNNSIEYLFTYEKRFRLISLLRIIRPASIYLFIFLLKFTSLTSSNILIIGFIAGNSLVLLFQLPVIIKNKLCRFYNHDLSLSGFCQYYRKHRKILIFNTASTGIVTVSMQIPYVFISTFYGENYSAYYGMSMRIIGMPLSLLGQSTGQVYFPKFSLIHQNNHKIFHLIKRLMSRLYSLGIIPFLLLFIFIPDIYILFLGENWDNAALLARILLPWLLVLMVSSPISNVIPVLGIQTKTIYYDIALFIARIACLYICSWLGTNFFVTMAIFSGIGVLFNLFFQFLILYLSKKYSR